MFGGAVGVAGGSVHFLTASNRRRGVRRVVLVHQKIVVKVSIHYEKCKKDVFKAVTKLTGIDQVSLDGEKGLLTIIGTVNPVDVVERIREKTKKWTSLESVGPVEAANPLTLRNLTLSI